MKNISEFLSENVQFLVVKISIYLNRRVFVMSKTGVYRGIHYFSYFCSKYRLWVLVRTTSARRFKRVPTIYVLSRNMKNIRIFLSENIRFFWWQTCQYI